MALTREFVLILAAIFALASPWGFTADAAKKAKKKAKKADVYEESKYKSRYVLTGPEPKTYRFDSKGNPIPPPSPRKPAKKKKKASGAQSQPQAEQPAPEKSSDESSAKSCSTGESCSEATQSEE